MPLTLPPAAAAPLPPSGNIRSPAPLRTAFTESRHPAGTRSQQQPQGVPGGQKNSGRDCEGGEGGAVTGAEAKLGKSIGNKAHAEVKSVGRYGHASQVFSNELEVELKDRFQSSWPTPLG